MADKEPKVGAAPSSSPSVTPKSLVTENHVRAALMSDKGAAAQLTAWKVVDFTKKGDNYTCLVTSVEVKYEYELDGKSSEVVYVVKINSGKTFGGENMFDLFFEKECKFFLDIAPQINSALREIGHTEINVPKCFHISLEKGKEVIFLEDLRARGYKMADRKQGLDEAHTTLVLRELARLHAASLLLQNKTPDEALGEKYPVLKIGIDYFVNNHDGLLNMIRESATVVQTIMKNVGGYKKVTAWIDTIIPRIADIFSEQLQRGEPKVVCHGDCWINNLLFRYSETGHPEEVMLLDLQVVNYSAPAADLNYLLYTSMTGDVRKPNIEAFLGSYYTTFKNIMEAAGQTVPFSQAQLLKDFRDRNLVGTIFTIMIVPVVLSETEGAVDSSKNDEDLEETFRKATEKALENVDANLLVKSRLLSVFDEMMELGIIP